MTPPSRPRPVHGPVSKTCVICDKEPRQHTKKELDTCLSRVFASCHSQVREYDPSDVGVQE